MLFAIAWAVSGAMAGDALGFSKEVGAFLAGVSIALTPYREQVAARLVSLRDFLLLFFFIELGAALDLGTLGAQVGASVVFSLFRHYIDFIQSGLPLASKGGNLV